MKWLMYMVLVLACGGAWLMFSNKGREIKNLQERIERVEEADAYDERLPEMKAQASSVQNERTFTGILLTFLSAGLGGILFVVHLLPFFAQRLTHAVYDSGEMVEKDVMHDARVLVAQGEYHAAIEAYKEAAKAEPLNRLPWVEIAKIQKTNLEDPFAAVETIRHALESQEWEINDAAYFLFRLAELYDEVMGDRVSAIAILRQVVEQFPRSRHSANANTRLHEWGADQEATAAPAMSETEPPPMSGRARYEVPPSGDEGSDRPA